MQSFLLQFHLILFDEFSEKLDYISFLQTNKQTNKKKVCVKNRKLRFSLAKSMISKPETYWNNVLFADESKFSIVGSDGRITEWRRKMKNSILRT